MKTKLTLATVGLVAVVLLALSGCSSTGTALKCPDLASRKAHIPSFAKATKLHHTKTDNTVTASTTAVTPAPASTETVPAKTMKPNLLAAAFNENAPFKIRIPKMMDSQMTQAQTDDVNSMLGQYSNNKVALERNEKGKLFIKADSRKDFGQLIKNLEKLKSAAAPIDGHVADILALVGGILGIVAIALSIVPFVHFVTLFPLGPGGIVLGAISLRNTSRRLWAILGIALGAAGITLAIITIILYTFFTPFLR